MKKQHAVMNPAYGYLNEADEYVGFDLQQAALYTDEDVDQLLDEGLLTREDITMVSFTEDQLDNEVPFDMTPYSEKEPAQDSRNDYSETTAEKFALLNPSYGYLNKDVEYESFDLSDAAIYTDEDVERLGLDTDDFVKQPFTDKQLEDVPFKDGIPTVLDEPFGYGDNTPEKEDVTESTANVITPEFDFADFGKGLDDLDDVEDLSQNK